MFDVLLRILHWLEFPLVASPSYQVFEVITIELGTFIVAKTSLNFQSETCRKH
eukprot:UN23794